MHKKLNLLKDQIAYFQSINSTNLYLKNHLIKNPKSNLKLCLTEHQTQGQGTRGNKWESPDSGNIYMTYKISIPNILPLPIISAVAIAEAIEKLHPGLNIQLKWPNDIMINNKKIGGILIEIINNNITALIGIGLNLNPIKSNNNINQPITDIKSELNNKNLNNKNYNININRENIIKEIIKNINLYINKINLKSQQTETINNIINKWNSRDYYYQKNIIIKIKDKKITAEHLGIMPCGSLNLKIKSEIKKISSGSIQEIY